MASANVIYSRGFPYGAPLVMLRGGALRDEQVKKYVKAEGFRWDGRSYAWTHYMDRRDFGAVLKRLRDNFNCIVLPKADMDRNYMIDLDDYEFGRPE